MSTIVIGLGNAILRDDGVGIRVVRLVQQELEGQPGIDFMEGTLGGLGLMERLVGYDRAVIVDAIITGRCQPGTQVIMTEMPGMRHTWSSHDTTLTVALELGRALGLALPGVMRIWGVEVSDVDTFGEALSPGVEAAIPGVVREVVAYLRAGEGS